MARGDPIFMRLDVSVWWDLRFRKLTCVEKLIFLTILAIAVEHKRTALPADVDARAIADRAGDHGGRTPGAIESLVRVGLLRRLPDGRLHVPDVRRNNFKIPGWHILPEDGRGPGDTVEGEAPAADPYLPHKGQEGEFNTTEETRGERGCWPATAPDQGAIPGDHSRRTPDLPLQIPRPSPPADEAEPTEQQLLATEHRVEDWTTADLIRFTATGSRNGSLTHTLTEALQSVSQERLRGICIYLCTKANSNRWERKKIAAALTQRCKEAMEESAA